MGENGDPALIGRTIANKYVVEKFLGGGAMGAVYKARQTALEKTVAVKVMHRSVAVDPSFVMRFRREAKAASRIDHPNVMRVMDFDEEPDGLLYIAMEFLDGRDLYRVIHEDWPLPIGRIATILTQTLSAIGAGHDMGVIHRDLKPENIMIIKGRDAEGNDTDSLVKVCDFGIAKITEKDDEPPPPPGTAAGQKLTTQGLVVGTPEYMSPEQARGEKLDARSDLYSMGIILYQLLTGRTPFTGETPLSIVLKHITEMPLPPRDIYEDVHPGLAAVCMKAIAKTREERFQSAREMRDMIRAAVRTGTIPQGIATAATQAISSRDVLATPGMTGPMVSSGVPPATAPTVVGAIGQSNLTPLGTAAAPPEKKKSSALPIFAGVLVAGALAGGGAYMGITRAPKAGDTAQANALKGGPTATATTTTNNATPTSPSSTTPTSLVTADPSPPDGKTPKRPTTTPKGPAAAIAHVDTPQASAAAPQTATPPTPPTPDPPAAPPPSTAAVPAPPPAAPPPAPAPAFDPATCHVQVGAVSTNGAANAKDLSLRSQGAWTSCARSGIKDKPSGPVSAKVTIRFSDNRAFRGASCAGCPGAVAACIAQSTGPTVSVNFKGGDVTGDPEFFVPVTFTCD